VWPPPEKAPHEWHLYTHIAQILKIAPPDFGVYARLLAQSWPEVEVPFPAYLVAMPGASVPYKIIPLVVSGELLKEITGKLDLPIIFLGSKKERPYVQELRKFLPLHRVEDLTGSHPHREHSGAASGVGSDRRRYWSYTYCRHLG